MLLLLSFLNTVIATDGNVFNLYNNHFVYQIVTGWFVLKLSGRTLSVRVMKDERGRSRGFGFVNYANHEDAQKVVCATFLYPLRLDTCQQ